MPPYETDDIHVKSVTDKKAASCSGRSAIVMGSEIACGLPLFTLKLTGEPAGITSSFRLLSHAWWMRKGDT
jgi:hypothetical protein